MGLFLHKTWDISFTLILDNFGIKYYTNQDTIDHLIASIHKKYPFKVDWDRKQYIRIIHLNWDYIKHMNDYIEQNLNEFRHKISKQYH